MNVLPADLAKAFVPASDLDIRALSYGMVKQPRLGLSWEQARGSLDDQAIFGTLRSLECACGKFRGADHRGIVCDRCGVKVASSEIRRSRFGHVELDREIAHPFGIDGARLTVWPVLPGDYFCSAGGKPLAALYDRLAVAIHEQDMLPVRSAVWKICDALLPLLQTVFDWKLSDAPTLARGLALVPRAEAAAENERCPGCGYPFAGLATRFCPGCGQQLQDDA